MLTEDHSKMPDKNHTIRISAILAMDQNKLIGASGTLPWYLPADLQHFKKITLNHVIIMGRKTYLSIGKPLPGRTNIIVTHDATFQANNCLVAHSSKAALALANQHKNTEIFIIGGAEIYNSFMPFVTTLYITEINHAFSGDTYFTAWNKQDWREIERVEHAPDEKNAYPYTFLVFERK